MCCVEVDTTVSLDSLKKPVVHGSAEVSCKTLLVGKRTESMRIDHADLIAYIFSTLNCLRKSHIDLKYLVINLTASFEVVFQIKKVKVFHLRLCNYETAL